MPIVAGLDPSLTSFGAAVITPDDYHTKRFSSQPSGPGIYPRMRRFYDLIELTMRWLDDYQPEVVFLEGYAFVDKQAGNVDRYEFGGLLRYYLTTTEYINSLYEVAPTTLKKFGAGKGNVKKIQAVAIMCKRWDLDPEAMCDDEVEAYALARMAACFVGMEDCENQKQTEAITTVCGPQWKMMAAAPPF